MAVIAQEQDFWGLRKWNRELPSGTMETLIPPRRVRLSPVIMTGGVPLQRSPITIEKKLLVVSDDEVLTQTQNHGPKRYRREHINDARLQRERTVFHALRGRRTRYMWQPSAPGPSAR